MLELIGFFVVVLFCLRVLLCAAVGIGLATVKVVQRKDNKPSTFCNRCGKRSHNVVCC